MPVQQLKRTARNILPSFPQKTRPTRMATSEQGAFAPGNFRFPTLTLWVESGGIQSGLPGFPVLYQARPVVQELRIQTVLPRCLLLMRALPELSVANRFVSVVQGEFYVERRRIRRNAKRGFSQKPVVRDPERGGWQRQIALTSLQSGHELPFPE